MVKLENTNEENLKGNFVINFPEIKIKESNIEVKNSLIKYKWIWVSALLAYPVGIGCLIAYCDKMESIPAWLLILIYAIVVIAFIAFIVLFYREVNAHTQHILEEAKAISALKRKVIEDAIMRDIKLQEKNITEGKNIKTADDKDKISKYNDMSSKIDEIVNQLTSLGTCYSGDITPINSVRFKEIIGSIKDSISALK